MDRETLFECVVNVSEGSDLEVVDDISRAGGNCTLDVHSDPHHNRSVLTLAGPLDLLASAVRQVAAATVDRIDIAKHSGVHPRIGALDVVPFVDLTTIVKALAEPRRARNPTSTGSTKQGQASPGACEERNRFAIWAAENLSLPCFFYGDERSLPEVRRCAWNGLMPDVGPLRPHPTAGAAAVGCRPPLVAYNVWLVDADLDTAKAIAASVRSTEVRALGLQVGNSVQVSFNLVRPLVRGPGFAYDAVAAVTAVSRAELVGLIPRDVLRAEARARWQELDLSEAKTIESRLEEAGLDGGRFELT